ncbi:MAG: type II toxin-antitoxin system RatA family toxin [Gammaproteobacteria bacterium]|nr:type II toxin-antitoxin system RatA family toxin [Gammaproteobacteria bacterium]
MLDLHRSALLPYPAMSVYDIVNDVERYPEFLPWCSDVAVLEQSEDEIVAQLSLQTHGLSERVTTRNRLMPHRRIELELVAGPFKSFTGSWTFTRLGEDVGCKIELFISFQLAGAQVLFGHLFSNIVSRVGDQLVDAFCERARILLG